MKKLLIFSLIIILILAGCANSTALPLEEEAIKTFDVTPVKSLVPISEPITSGTVVTTPTMVPTPTAPSASPISSSTPSTSASPAPATSASPAPATSASPTPATSALPTSTVSPAATFQVTPVAVISLDEKLNSIGFYLIAGTYSRNVLQDNQKTTEMFSFDKTNFIRITSNDFEQEIFAYNYISDNFTYLYYFENELISKTIFNIATGAILEDREGYSELLKVRADDLKIYFYELIESAAITIDNIS